MSRFELLIVGSGLDAHLALQALLRCSGKTQLHHLPTPIGRHQVVHPVRACDWPVASGPGQTSAVGKARLTDVWGKCLVELQLPELLLLEPTAFEQKHPDVKSLPLGLSISRVQASGKSYLVSFSDGSELLVEGVVFADGPTSMAQKFWKLVPQKPVDSYRVRTWSFESQNLLNFATWEFRWAAAKSVEILPLCGNRLRVTLRFKSPFGAKLSVAELSDLFSEFGSDMGAIFEGLKDEAVLVGQEEKSPGEVFRPAHGCLALGSAAWSSSPNKPFSWSADFVVSQLRMLKEQTRVGSFCAESLEAQSKELMQDLERRDQFFRRNLHNDNAVLRPIINFFFRLCPKSILAKKLGDKISL